MFLEDRIKIIIAGVLCVEKDKVKNDALPDKDIADKNKVSEIINYIKKRMNATVSR